MACFGYSAITGIIFVRLELRLYETDNFQYITYHKEDNFSKVHTNIKKETKHKKKT